MVPLPSKRTPISTITSPQVKKLKGRDLTRDEIEQELGKPDEYFADVRVACYPLNQLNRTRLVLLLCVLPVFGYPDRPGGEVAMIQYDEQGRVTRVGIRKQFPYSRSFRRSALDWSSK